MTSTNANPQVSPSALELGEREFAFLSQLVYELSGIRLGDAKRELVLGRLMRRLRALKLSTFEEYCARLESDSNGGELQELLNAITTNVTAFFREPHHFQLLREKVIGEKVAASGPKKLRLWSAGCSIGAEPWSIAMTARDALPETSGWDIRILATDLDTTVLARAAEGVYPAEDVEKVPEALRRRFFLKGSGSSEGSARIKDELRKLVTFRRHNLVGEWPMKGPFDAIFCRNVVIYFDRETQKKVVSHFAERLSPKGFLFLGHSESLLGVNDDFELIGSTTYRRRG